MGTGNFGQFARGAVAKEKPYNRASPVGNAPLLPPAAASLRGKASHTILRSLRFPTNRVRLPPRRGRFALHFAYRFISSTEAERKANFPLRGKPREAGIGVHFHRAEGPVCLFSPPGRAVLWFYQNWRRRRPPQPSGQRPVKPKNLKNLRARRARPPFSSAPSKLYTPFHFML